MSQVDQDFEQKRGYSAQLQLVFKLSPLFLIFAATRLCNGANTVTVTTFSLSVTGSSPNFAANFGNMNGLGLGTPSANVTDTLSGGSQLYWSEFGLTLNFSNSGTGVLKLEVGTDYTHNTVQTAYYCHGGTCDTVTPVALTTSYLTVASNLSSGNYTIYLGTAISPANGAGAFSGSDSVTLTFQSTSSAGSPGTSNLTFNVNVQNAVQLALATSGAGVTISPASDFSASYGTVNGLGVGTPGAGLTALSVSGGTVYASPVSVLPVYSSFTSSTGTLSTYVGSNFAHSTLLKLEDASTSGGPYTAISLTSATPTTITTTAASGSTVTRYLGLFVSNLNGGSAFSGADNATATYTLTVP